MAEPQDASINRPKVFISYSRRDGASLAQELIPSLEAAGFETYFDKDDIEKAVDWEDRLKQLILKADNVVFIITPSSVRSPRCAWEVDRTVEMSKRLIPVQWIEVPEAEVPERIRRLNWIFFGANRSFAQGLSELVMALKQDVEWIRAHTTIGEEADRWKKHPERGDDLLLRGRELAEALVWQQRRKADAPAITALQKEFLDASQVGERKRIARSRRVSALLAVLSIVVAAGSFAWFKGQWVKENYFKLTQVRGHVQTSAQEVALADGSGFQDCTSCPQMVVLPSGAFAMGAPENQGEANEKPQHQVTIAKRFAMGKLEVTFEQWDTCVAYGDCDRSIVAGDWGRDRQPVINVTWDQTQRYLAWLSRVTGKSYRLASEAEWEYAARARTQTLYSFGNQDEIFLPQFAWFAANAEGRSHPVGQKKANQFGIQDVYGNVKEWVQDCWNDTYKGAPADGRAWTSGDCKKRVARGGGWQSYPKAMRASAREWYAADDYKDVLGFRVVRDIGP